MHFGSDCAGSYTCTGCNVHFDTGLTIGCSLCFPGSPSLRSPTENSIASLVSAAAIVKAKSESEGECHMSTGKRTIHALPGADCSKII